MAVTQVKSLYPVGCDDCGEVPRPRVHKVALSLLGHELIESTLSPPAVYEKISEPLIWEVVFVEIKNLQT